MKEVTLRIDELVLHGLPAAHRYAIADAIQQELTRLVGAHGLPAIGSRSRHQDRVQAPQAMLPADASPDRAGRIIARAIYGSLNR